MTPAVFGVVFEISTMLSCRLRFVVLIVVIILVLIVVVLLVVVVAAVVAIVALLLRLLRLLRLLQLLRRSPFKSLFFVVGILQILQVYIY